ncbi:MAG: hypothetical protein U0Q11_23740 [Vicinamibacterales bacterium]
MGSPLLPLVASLALAASAFLPWLRLGDVGLAGVPDPAGFFVLALGVLGAVLSLMRLFARRDTRRWLMLIGLAGLTVLIVVWRTGPVTIADRAQAHAEAIALVDNVPMTPVPAVHLGIGLMLGLVSSAAVLAAGLNGIIRRPEL